MSNSQFTITRIDLKDFPNQDGVTVKKFADGWQPNTPPVEISTQRQMSCTDMADWLESHGWHVVRWEACPVLGIPAGARAFKGQPRSVRTRWQLKKYRDELVEKADAYLRTPESYNMANGPTLVYRVHVLDLAYEL